MSPGFWSSHLILASTLPIQNPFFFFVFLCPPSTLPSLSRRSGYEWGEPAICRHTDCWEPANLSSHRLEGKTHCPYRICRHTGFWREWTFRSVVMQPAGASNLRAAVEGCSGGREREREEKCGFGYSGMT